MAHPRGVARPPARGLGLALGLFAAAGLTLAAGPFVGPGLATTARPIAIDGSLDGIETLYATYDSLTPDDIRAAARTVFATERRTLGILRGTG